MSDGSGKEVAEAVRTVAQATSDAVHAGTQVGNWLSRLFGPALGEFAGMAHDKMRFTRTIRLMKLAKKFDQTRADLGFNGPIKHVSEKFGVPLIEAAAVEDDETIMSMLATLLANATNNESEREPRQAFISIIKEMNALDARVFMSAYTSPPVKENGLRIVYTTWLPETFLTEEHGRHAAFGLPRPEVHESLWNLARLGLMEPGGGWDGASFVTVVTLTTLGDALLAAASTPAQREAFRPVAPAEGTPPA